MKGDSTMPLRFFITFRLLTVVFANAANANDFLTQEISAVLRAAVKLESTLKCQVKDHFTAVSYWNGYWERRKSSVDGNSITYFFDKRGNLTLKFKFKLSRSLPFLIAFQKLWLQQLQLCKSKNAVDGAYS